jgi:hypothetical protein
MTIVYTKEMIYSHGRNTIEGAGNQESGYMEGLVLK